MGFFDKVMFWKKKEGLSDFGAGSPFEQGASPFSQTGLQGMGQAPGTGGFGTAGGEHLGFSESGMPESFLAAPSAEAAQPRMPALEPAKPEPKYEFSARDNLAKELEIISAKLDSIRSAVESLNARVSNIESVMRSEYETKYEARQTARW